MQHADQSNPIVERLIEDQVGAMCKSAQTRPNVIDSLAHRRILAQKPQLFFNCIKPIGCSPRVISRDVAGDSEKILLSLPKALDLRHGLSRWLAFRGQATLKFRLDRRHIKWREAVFCGVDVCLLNLLTYVIVADCVRFRLLNQMVNDVRFRIFAPRIAAAGTYCGDLLGRQWRWRGTFHTRSISNAGKSCQLRIVSISAGDFDPAVAVKLLVPGRRSVILLELWRSKYENKIIVRGQPVPYLC
jgi:hypothetical protein